MEWDEETIEGIGMSLNEADVLGLRLDGMSGSCELLVHVWALPEHGPIDPDARRLLQLTSPARIRVLLRVDNIGAGYGPAIPIEDLKALEAFFASLKWAGSMYGGRFLDDPQLTQGWPTELSLDITHGTGRGSHTLYWFDDCGRDEDDNTTVAYRIEGEIRFEDLEILRADGTPQDVGEFIADGRRFWKALFANDPRLDHDSQRAAQTGTPSWRPYMRQIVS